MGKVQYPKDDPWGKFEFKHTWGGTELYESLMKEHFKDKIRSEFDIEYNGYFYEYSDMGELIMNIYVGNKINELSNRIQFCI